MTIDPRIPAALTIAALLLATPAPAQNCQTVTELASRTSNGVIGNASSRTGRLSLDGRYVVFTSFATNLATGPTGSSNQVYRRDRVTGKVVLVSSAAGGAAGNGDSDFPAVSDDGRWVAFRSEASNLISGDTNGVNDVFVKDLKTNAVERVSVSSLEGQGNGMSLWPDISGDGRYVVFESLATNLLAFPENNGHWDVYLRDRLAGTTALISVAPGGALGNGASRLPAISADGMFVAFQSTATNLVGFDTNGFEDVFLRDRAAGVTVRASVGPPIGFGLSVQVNADATSAALSDDGRFVSFVTAADNLVTLDGNAKEDVFVRDLQTGVTSVASNALGPFVATSNGRSRQGEISGDGRFVVFISDSTNLISGPNGDGQGIYVRDRTTQTTKLVSKTTAGVPAPGSHWNPDISRNGLWAAFDSKWSGFAGDDSNGSDDVIAHGLDCSFPFVYGVAKTTSNGCLPQLGWIGVPTSDLTGGFVITCDQVINQKPGILLYGVSGPAALPFQGGTLYVQSPLLRSSGLFSNGLPLPANDCSGNFVLNMDAFAAGALGGNPLPALKVAGTVVNAQWWGRDPAFTAPNNTMLSQGLEFTVRP